MNDIDFGQYLGQYMLLNIITSIKIIPDFCIMIRKKVHYYWIKNTY